jgi:hypothetical protein
MTTLHDLNFKLAQMIVGDDLTNVTGFDLCVRVGQLPKITVHRELISSGQVDAVELKFELTPLDED